MLKAYFEDVEVLSQLLEKQLRLVLSRTLNTVRKEPTVIVTALRIIEREEKADAFALQVWSIGSPLTCLMTHIIH
jgi:exocyst complex component 3